VRACGAAGAAEASGAALMWVWCGWWWGMPQILLVMWHAQLRLAAAPHSGTCTGVMSHSSFECKQM
jgi:hypothetical protein